MSGSAERDRTFRERLRGELAEWEAEGLVTREQAGALEARYALGELSRERAGRLLATIYTIGAILVGCGVISFVAANWQALPKLVRAALVLAAMLGAHAGGYWLWRVRGTREGLGHALVTLGTLLLGANLALMGQIFHIQGSPDAALGAWAVGAAAMAWALRSAPSAAIAIVVSVVWFGFATSLKSYRGEAGVVLHHPVHWYPWLLLLLALPFAYSRRSAAVATLTLLGFAISAHVALVAPLDVRWLAFAAGAIALALSGYGVFHLRVRPRVELAAPALVVAAITLVAWSFLLSFRVPARELLGGDGGSGLSAGGVGTWAPLVVLTGAGLAFWGAVVRRGVGDPTLRALLLAFVGPAFLLAAGPQIRESGVLVIAANASLVLLAAGLVWCGYATLRRPVFWAGVLLVAVVIVSRFFEYETGLLLKSAAFIASGVGMIAGGVRFENHARGKGVLS